MFIPQRENPLLLLGLLLCIFCMPSDSMLLNGFSVCPCLPALYMCPWFLLSFFSPSFIGEGRSSWYSQGVWLPWLWPWTEQTLFLINNSLWSPSVHEPASQIVFPANGRTASRRQCKMLFPLILFWFSGLSWGLRFYILYCGWHWSFCRGLSMVLINVLLHFPISFLL